jgi:hypothetical protein
MNMVFRSRLLLVLSVFSPLILVLQPAHVDAQTRSGRPSQRPRARDGKREDERIVPATIWQSKGLGGSSDMDR